MKLLKVGFFVSALIKISRCQPKFSKDKEIKAHFKDNEVRPLNAWLGTIHGQYFLCIFNEKCKIVCSVLQYPTC